MAKKKVVPRRPKTGVGAAPVEDFYKFQYHFHYELENKSVSEVVKNYVKKTFNKNDSQAILANPEWCFTAYSGIAAAIHWMALDKEFPPSYRNYPQEVKNYLTRLIESGKTLLAQKKQDEKAQSNVKVLTPQQRMAKKIFNTILADLDALEDQWCEGEKTDINLYDNFRLHQLKGAAVQPVRERLEAWLSEYEDIDVKEYYPHLPKVEINRRVKVIKQMLADVDKFKSAAKAARTTKVKRQKAADKQVARVKYQKEDQTYKLVSISPLQIVGATRLYTFNTKSRRLTYYFTDATSGFEVSGTSIKNFDVEQSTQMTLRANKVDEILGVVMRRTPNQIIKALGELSSKPSVPNGRLNEDTILLRVV